jgi:ABC-type polysaccharide/polyol phosphate transport system ATPase subunit
MATTGPTIEQPLTGQEGALAGARASAPGPVAIEVRGVEKAFRVPEQRVDSLKERATHPFRRIDHRTLRALRGVSFDVRRGEFFGIVGRNGSGKSTLLKIMASIYRADAGSVRMAGRMAPFIELGVGFDPELTARENAVLNGVLMGLTRAEARRRLPAVIEFAELQEFEDLKLKNYSSGMMVRLAFAIMVQADAEIMLIDEVLAVGDAAFAQKCMDVFHERRRAGRTVVLVTHDMATVQSLCHRALLLHDGQTQFVGEPEEAAIRYYRLNFGEAGREGGSAPTPDAVMDLNVRVLEAAVRDAAGRPVEALEQGVAIGVDISLRAARDLDGPSFVFHVVNAEGVVVAAFTKTLSGRVAAGGRVSLRGQVENPLVPGRYYLDCWVRQDEQQSLMALQALRLLSFVVFGTTPRHGLVTLRADLEPVVEAGQ